MANRVEDDLERGTDLDLRGQLDAIVGINHALIVQRAIRRIGPGIGNTDAVFVLSEDVIYDHQLSNQYIKAIADDIVNRLKEQGLDSDKLLPFFSAPLNGIEAFLNEIETQFGSMDSYLKKAVCIDEDCLQKVRKNLL